jgi:NhaP-type Na+/H+ or K+/H+ antiporter
MLAPATVTSFEASLLALGGLLMVGALVSGIANRSLLSLAALFVLAGFLLGAGALNVLHFHAQQEFVRDVATVALIIILFRDGLEVDAEALTHWHLPFRALVLAMPLTTVFAAAGARVLIGLSWTECFLLAALLAPTDPVLSSSVVTNPRVPAVIRHSLNLESGLNDGLALPIVLVFAAELVPGGEHLTWWRFLLEDVTIGLAAGLLVGFAAPIIMPRQRGRLEGGIPGHQKALYALGVALVAYGVAVLLPHGNGLIATYVAAITLGIRRPDLRAHFEAQSETIVEIVKLGVFVVFGSLLTVHGLLADGWSGLAFAAVVLALARPLAVLAALIGTATDVPTRAFIGWFGPKGVSSIAFMLFVLNEEVPNAARISNLVALTVFCSIVLHGASDTAGAAWIARHSERARIGGAAGGS